MLAPLRHRDFRLLLFGQTVSIFGNQLSFVALPFQILALKGTALQLGTGFTIFATAQLATILFGGALVDRLSRRRVILGTDLISGVVVGAVAWLGVAHRLEISHLYILSAFFGATFSFYTPAMQAIMPELVPKEILVPGNALRAVSRQTATPTGRRRSPRRRRHVRLQLRRVPLLEPSSARAGAAQTLACRDS